MTSITARLSRIQKALKAPKSQNNTFGKYKYRNCEDILEALKPLLQDDETIIISDEVVIYGQNPSKRENDGDVFNDKGEVIGQQSTNTVYGDRFYIKATATFHADGKSISSSALAREPFEKKGMDASQVTGATSSYARKYALNGLLLIDDTKDADATNNGKDETKADEKPDESTPYKSAKQFQNTMVNKISLCKSIGELDILMNDNTDMLERLKSYPELYEVVEHQENAIRDGGPIEDPVLKFGSVGEAESFAKSCTEYLDANLDISELAMFENNNMPFLIKSGKNKDKPSALDQSLSAKKYQKDGSSPSDRIISKFKQKLQHLQAGQL